MLPKVMIVVRLVVGGALLTTLVVSDTAGAEDRLVCFVSILPQAYFVDRIGGQHVETHVMVGPGQSPATYEPTTRQLSRLTQSKVYFSIGVAFEEPLLPRIRRNFQGVRIIDTRKGIELRSMIDHSRPDAASRSETTGREVGGAPQNDHTRGMPDPHVWLSPRLAVTIAENIRDGLVSLDSKHAGEYTENCDRLAGELLDLDRRIATILSPIKGEEILVFHPAYGYFTDAYGLVQIAIENEGSPPGPKYLAGVIERGRRNGVTTIFVQKQFSATMAETVAAEIGADIVRLDPLAEDYMDNLLRMAEKIRAAFETDRENP